ncbi:hypothetical protein AOLI_G00046470 [Acnodon oligacanthus]
MKNYPGVDIERAVDSAKKEANELLHRSWVWEYDLIRKILDNPDPVGRIINELQDTGVLFNIPPPPPPPPKKRPSSYHSSRSTCSPFSKGSTS